MNVTPIDLATLRRRRGRRVLGAFVSAALIAGSAVQSAAVDSNSDNVDDALISSFAAAGVQSFPESDAGPTATVSVINFSTSGTPSYSDASLTNGSTIAATRLDDSATVNIGTGAGSITLGNALVWGGAGNTGQYATPGGSGSPWTLTFSSTQRYLGFWWSAGNSDNQIQLLDANGNTLLSPNFSTASIISTLLDGNNCPNSKPSASDITAAPWKAYCGNPNSAYVNGYVDEPFAFVHLRFETGFRAVRMWGTGFEFDNLTFSETIPSFGDSEEVVGTTAVDTVLPSAILIDQRTTALSLPVAQLSNSNNAMVCFSQVANSAGGTLSGSATISIARSSTISGVTETATTNLWRYSGTRAAVQDQIPLIELRGVSGNPIVTTGSKWLRVHLTSDTSGAAACNDSQINRVVELRSISVSSADAATVDVG